MILSQENKRKILIWSAITVKKSDIYQEIAQKMGEYHAITAAQLDTCLGIARKGK